MFGIDNNVGKPAVEAAVDKLEPLLRNVEMRAAGILHVLLNRLNGTKITVVIEIPPPKAQAANPAPKEY